MILHLRSEMELTDQNILDEHLRRKKLFFVAVLNATDENSRIHLVIGTHPRIRDPDTYQNVTKTIFLFFSPRSEGTQLRSTMMG
jgi:hypothetical protein